MKNKNDMPTTSKVRAVKKINQIFNALKIKFSKRKEREKSKNAYEKKLNFNDILNNKTKNMEFVWAE